MKPIYQPKGRAAEYGEYAINIYDSCNMGCSYCWARKFAERFGKPWTGDVRPRDGIVEATIKQLSTGKYAGKTIHLCFTCDPYPVGADTTATREIIKAIKAAGAHVQILTKNGNDACRDLRLLDGLDWFGITVDGLGNDDFDRFREGSVLESLYHAWLMGIRTWVSCEPVFNPNAVYGLIKNPDFIDRYMIGKLNYQPSDINWKAFGHECERLCKEYGRNYYIKEDLRREMEKS